MVLPGGFAMGDAGTRGSLAVSEEVELHLPAAAVWQIIGNYNSLSDWHPAIAGSKLEGTGKDKGDRRLLTMTGGEKLVEELIDYDNDTMQYAYRITDNPFPFRNYQATIRVAPQGDHCRITWSSTFDARGATDEEVIALIRGVYRTGFDGLMLYFSHKS